MRCKCGNVAFYTIDDEPICNGCLESALLTPNDFEAGRMIRQLKSQSAVFTGLMEVVNERSRN